jgi:hypothetical protein
MLLKSPKDLRDGVIFRLFPTKRKNTLTGHGFLSMLSSILYLRFGSSANDSTLYDFIEELNDSPKVFLIDEFVSLNCLDIKKLRNLGFMIYVSQDVAYKRFGFGDNRILKKLMFRLESEAINNFDLVVACSEMERLEYLEMRAKKAIFYPNIYPTKEFNPCEKDELPSISIVLREHWGTTAADSLKTIFEALARINTKIKVYVIGMKPKDIPGNIVVEHSDFIPSKSEYLKLISKTWIGINLGIHMAGTNERKYDYAEAGLVIFSDAIGTRGDLFPYEYTFVDKYDFTSKLDQLLKFGKPNLKEMGEKNRQAALTFAKLGTKKLRDSLNQINS